MTSDLSGKRSNHVPKSNHHRIVVVVVVCQPFIVNPTSSSIIRREVSINDASGALFNRGNTGCDVFRDWHPPVTSIE